MDFTITRREALLGTVAIALTACSTQAGSGKPEQVPQVVVSPEQGDKPAASARWQDEVSFPEWKSEATGRLHIKSMHSYLGYHGQGTIQISVADKVEDFSLYVNGHRIETSKMSAGGTYDLDVSALAVNGTNTLQVSNIRPFDLDDAVIVRIPYPVVLEGNAAEEGISLKTLQMVSDLIETDIEHGFTSASLAIVRNGRLVYQNAWGLCNSYLPDGTRNTAGPEVATSTLYDLASNTKMYTVNYAIQRLVTEGKLDVNSRICDHLGEAFASETILANAEIWKIGDLDLDTVKKWKAGLTVRDLLCHQGGFPADPMYPVQNFDMSATDKENPYRPNELYAGSGADEETKKNTIQMINRTPLRYEPGTKTVYSDADYMILGLVVEKVSGMALDEYLKKTFFEPMGLDRITYNPLKAGFVPDDCAATELGNSGRYDPNVYKGYRTQTIQGEVHDEKAYYSMMGVSGHAGLFASAPNLATLASVMLTGGYGEHRFFSKDVIDAFTAPKSVADPTWGLGWWREADTERPWYFGTQSSRSTVGHQGWTGTMTMVDPSRNLVVVYLTNKINSPVTDAEENADVFDGNWYTAATLGFVPQIISMGMDTGQDVADQLLDLSVDMALESLRIIPDSVDPSGGHPSVRNFESKRALFEKLAEGCADADRVSGLRKSIEAAHAHVLEKQER